MKRYLVLLGCFIGLTVATSAILMIPLGLYMKAMTAEFGWSRTQFSTVLALAGVSYALTMPVAGFLVDRFGSPRVIVSGVVLGSTCYAALSQVSSFAMFAALVCLTVVTGTLAGYPAYLGLVQRWFDKRLGLALAIASAGVAVGVACSSWAITSIIASQGWRSAFLIIGCAALAIGLANAILFLRDNRGPVPEAERVEHAPEGQVLGASLSEALRQTDFWLYTASFTLLLVAAVGTNFHLPALLADDGASPSQIASVIALVSAGSLVGRLATGTMLDRWPARIVASMFYIGQVVGLLLLLHGLSWALPAGFLLGAAQGAEIDLMGFLIARRFGRLAYGRIFGSCFAVTLIAVIVSPVLTAMIYDRAGSYDIALMAFPVLTVVALLLLLRSDFLRGEPKGGTGQLSTR